MTKKKSRRVIFLALADLHSGHTLALMSPDTILEEEDEHGRFVPYSPPLGALQRKLWPWFVGDVEKLKALAGKDEIIVALLGDLVQGKKHRALLVGPQERAGTQVTIALANLAPILSLPNIKKVRILGGTAAHDGIGMGTSLAIAKAIRAMYPRLSVEVMYHLDASIDGLHIDSAHHGPPPGSRVHLEGNIALAKLRDIVSSYHKRTGEVAARIHLRAHRHVYVSVPYRTMIEGAEYDFEMVLLPSWSGVGDFARQVTQSVDSQEFGMVAIEIVGGELIKLHPFIHVLDLRSRETL